MGVEGVVCTRAVMLPWMVSISCVVSPFPHRLNAPPVSSCTASNPSDRRLCQCYPGVTCPTGYSLYMDTDGSEGHASCFAVVNSALSIPAATAACPSGTHMLTLTTSSSTGAVITFLYNLGMNYNSPRYWLGVRFPHNARLCPKSRCL